jgi:hypothetical protein
VLRHRTIGLRQPFALPAGLNRIAGRVQRWCAATFNGEITMAKSLDSKKDKKKAPLKTAKEKKAEKTAKKAAK